MKKKRAKLNFAGIIFICVLLVILSIVKIPAIPYNGFFRSINLGIDYNGGTTLVLEAKNNTSEKVDFSAGTKAHAGRIQNILSSSPYNYDAKAYAVAGSNIIVEIYDNCDIDEILDIITLTDEGNEFKAVVSTEDGAESYLSSDDIKNATIFETGSPSRPYGIQIDFTSEGKEHYSSMLDEAKNGDKKYWFMIGSEYFLCSKDNGITVEDDTVAQESIGFYVSASSKQQAQIFVDVLMATKFNFSFEKLSSTVITEEIANRNLLLSCIIAGVIVLACFVLLIVRFKKLGLVDCLALLLGLLVQIMMLQAVPNMVLTSTSFVASVLTFIIGFVMVYYLLSKIASEYAIGKKAHISFKYGYQKNFATLLEISISYLVASIIFYIFGSTTVRYFAYASVVGIIIYALVSLLMVKWFNKLCFDLYLEKANNYGFTRGADVNELEEI